MKATETTMSYGSFATTSTGQLIQVGVMLGAGFVEATPASGMSYRVAIDTLTPSAATSFPLTIEYEAAKLQTRVYANHGRGTLSCSWCGGSKCVIDADAIANPKDLEAIARLIEHTRQEHTGPADVLFTAPIIVLKGVRA